MTPLETLLRARIEREGPIPVADFMAAANNHPEHGYYRHRDPLGRAGDFITAPEISQVFGELIGAWCAVIWQMMGAPERVLLAELGPGRGTLMADALRATRTVSGFHRAAEIHLVETSPHLRGLQRQALADREIAWQERFEDIPAGPMILIANEFFDALPVEQYVRRHGRWHRRSVDIDPADGCLRFVDGPVSAPAVPECLAYDEDGIWEDSPSSRVVIKRIAARIAEQGGAGLIIDYGHAGSAVGETLQAVAGHRFADCLASPGEADLSAHVDFAALSRSAQQEGARVFGPIGQGRFLERLGIGPRMARLARDAEPTQREAVAFGCLRLVDPGGMGTLFKAMSVAHAGLPAPAGFEEDQEVLA